MLCRQLSRYLPFQCPGGFKLRLRIRGIRSVKHQIANHKNGKERTKERYHNHTYHVLESKSKGNVDQRLTSSRVTC